MSEPRKEVLAEGVECWLGDCREILPTLGRVDAVVTDPPYGIGEGNQARILSRGKLAAAKDYGNATWDAKPIDAALIDLIRSCSAHQIIFGGNYFDGLGPTSCWLVWDKQNGDNDFADCELAWTNLPKAVRRIYWRWNGMIRKGDDIREHPTQKPVGVMGWCIDQLPPAVKTICDPFSGSFTTGVAAIKRGKSFIGIEREPAYFEIGLRRLTEELAKPRLELIAAPEPVQEALW